MNDEIRDALLALLESLKFMNAQADYQIEHQYIVTNANAYDMYFIKADARQKFNLDFLPELVAQEDPAKEVYKIKLVGKVANLRSYIQYMKAKP